MKKIKFKITIVLFFLMNMFFVAGNSYGQTQDTLKKAHSDSLNQSRPYNKKTALDSARTHRNKELIEADSTKMKNKLPQNTGDSLKNKNPK